MHSQAVIHLPESLALEKNQRSKKLSRETVFRSCSDIFCAPDAELADVQSAGCKAVVSLFSGTTSDSLASLRYGYLCKKVATSNTFVTPEQLPPTKSALKYHSLCCYLQVMAWMGLIKYPNGC